MKLNRNRILLGALGLFTAVSFTGLITGTLAWYASNSRAALAFSGTSVRESEQLQIGLRSSQDFLYLDPNNEDFNLTKETIEGTDYYWAKAGSGLHSDAIVAYLSLQGRATTTLEPVTSREYNTGSITDAGVITKGDALHLYRAPMAFNPLEVRDAQLNCYSKISFAFRVLRTNDLGELVTAGNQTIWITHVAAHAGGPGQEIHKALRLYFEDERDRFILNPSSEASEKGATNLAGLLDLNGDEYYDFDPLLNSDHQEIIYGDYEGSLTPSANPTESDFVDVNGVGNDEPSTFVAKHAAGTQAYTSLEGLQPKKAQYETLQTIAPDDDGSGHLSHGRPVCVTADDEHNIAEMDMTIWLEGWDHSVVNQQMASGFDLGLQFQINRM